MLMAFFLLITKGGKLRLTGVLWRSYVLSKDLWLTVWTLRVKAVSSLEQIHSSTLENACLKPLSVHFW